MLPGATVVDVLDVRREHDNIIFVPAMLDFDDRSAVIEVEVFDDAMRGAAGYRAAEVQCGIPDDLYSFPTIWLRSRIAAEFGTWLPTSGDDSRGALLEFPFLAVLRTADGRFNVHPFVCCDTDDYTEPRLEFLPSCPPDVRSAIVAAFRSLMLADPCTLVSFDECCTWDFDYEAGWVWCGIDPRGQAFDIGLGDPDPEDEDHWLSDCHARPPGYETQACDTCGGAGEESFFPAGEPCELCGGTGRVSWRSAYPHDQKRPQRFVSHAFNRRS